MATNYVCLNCKKNISSKDFTNTHKMIRTTRYDGNIHVNCPHCGTPLVVIEDENYNARVIKLKRMLMRYGCKLICYYEGDYSRNSNVIEYHPPIFRFVDNVSNIMYRIAWAIINHNDEWGLNNTRIIREDDKSYTLTLSSTSWYFDTKLASYEKDRYTNLIKKFIVILLNAVNKYYKEKCV